MSSNQERCDKQHEDALEIVKESARLRKRGTLITSLTVITILIMILFLVLDLSHFARNYDFGAVSKEIQSEIPQLVSSDEMQSLLASLKDKVLPVYANAIIAKFEESESLFAEEFYTMMDDLTANLGPELHKRVSTELAQILVESTQLVRERYPDLTEDEIAVILDTFRNAVEAQYLERLQRQMTLLLGGMHETLNSIQDDPEYTRLASKSTEDIEKLFLTTALELMIYEIDPAAEALR
jgi:hypothetical protein